MKDSLMRSKYNIIEITDNKSLYKVNFSTILIVSEYMGTYHVFLTALPPAKAAPPCKCSLHVMFRSCQPDLTYVPISVIS